MQAQPSLTGEKNYMKQNGTQVTHEDLQSYEKGLAAMKMPGTGELASKLSSMAEVINSGEYAEDSLTANDLWALLQDVRDHVRTTLKEHRAVPSFRQELDSFETQPPGLPTPDRWSLKHEFLPGVPHVIAAYAGQGKTSTIINLAQYYAGRKMNVSIYSLEMTRRQLLTKLATVALKDSTGEAITYGHAENLFRNKDQKLYELVESYEPTLAVYDTDHITRSAAGVTVRDWLDQIKYNEAQKPEGQKSEVIFLDYVQLFKGDPKLDRRNQMIENLQEIAECVKRSEAIFILAAQTNRENQRGQSNAPKAPALHHLMESAALEQSAGSVITLAQIRHPEVEASCMELSIEKSRFGHVGNRYCSFDGASGYIGAEDKKTAQSIIEKHSRKKTSGGNDK